MKDFLCFRSMITPAIIQILFWLVALFCVFAGLFVMIHNHHYGIGLQILILGPLLTRVLCEMLIVLFRINDNLKQLNQQLSCCPEEDKHEL